MGFEKDLQEDLLVCVRGLLESRSPLTMVSEKVKVGVVLPEKSSLTPQIG